MKNRIDSFLLFDKSIEVNKFLQIYQGIFYSNIMNLIQIYIVLYFTIFKFGFCATR